jgi:HD domain
VHYAPANDPFAITVGVSDANDTLATRDDVLAGFSSYGVTDDGFSKPEIVATGRHVVSNLVRILHKPGPLDDDEWKVMKEHPLISEYILSEVDLNPIVLKVARSSHERMDGKGYPDGLPGDQIPLPARIVLVADAFDALTSDRPYRSGRTVAAAMAEVRAHSGTQFCPRVVAALETLYRDQPQLLGAVALRAVRDDMADEVA